MRAFFGMPKELLDFDDRVRHDATQATRDLGTLGITCPRPPDYVPRLVAFYREQRDRVRREAVAAGSVHLTAIYS